MINIVHWEGEALETGTDQPVSDLDKMFWHFRMRENLTTDSKTGSRSPQFLAHTTRQSRTDIEHAGAELYVGSLRWFQS